MTSAHVFNLFNGGPVAILVDGNNILANGTAPLGQGAAQLGNADRLVPAGQNVNHVNYPIRLLELGSLGRKNPIHFFKDAGQNGILIRFDYNPRLQAVWDWRNITGKPGPNIYQIDDTLQGSYHSHIQNGQVLLKAYRFDRNLVDDVIQRYEFLRANWLPYRQAGMYTHPNWNPVPNLITCPWVAALIVRWHNLEPAFWYNRGPGNPGPQLPPPQGGPASAPPQLPPAPAVLAPARQSLAERRRLRQILDF